MALSRTAGVTSDAAGRVRRQGRIGHCIPDCVQGDPPRGIGPGGSAQGNQPRLLRVAVAVGSFAGVGTFRTMNRNVWLLFACQALMNAVMSGQTVMASLVGYRLSGSALNTLPMAIQMISVMSASVIAGYAFPRLGRRGGFWLACAIMMSGSLTFAAGIYTANFPLYCLGAMPAGIGFGIAQHLRFAAAEVAAPEAKGEPFRWFWPVD